MIRNQINYLEKYNLGKDRTVYIVTIKVETFHKHRLQWKIYCLQGQHQFHFIQTKINKLGKYENLC